MSDEQIVEAEFIGDYESRDFVKGKIYRATPTSFSFGAYDDFTDNEWADLRRHPSHLCVSADQLKRAETATPEELQKWRDQKHGTVISRKDFRILDTDLVKSWDFYQEQFDLRQQREYLKNRIRSVNQTYGAAGMPEGFEERFKQKIAEAVAILQEALALVESKILVEVDP